MGLWPKVRTASRAREVDSPMRGAELVVDVLERADALWRERVGEPRRDGARCYGKSDCSERECVAGKVLLSKGGYGL
jgi:hypothetical protein